MCVTVRDFIDVAVDATVGSTVPEIPLPLSSTDVIKFLDLIEDDLPVPSKGDYDTLEAVLQGANFLGLTSPVGYTMDSHYWVRSYP